MPTVCVVDPWHEHAHARPLPTRPRYPRTPQAADAEELGRRIAAQWTRDPTAAGPAAVPPPAAPQALTSSQRTQQRQEAAAARHAATIAAAKARDGGGAAPASRSRGLPWLVVWPLMALWVAMGLLSLAFVRVRRGRAKR
jgi:hypothetical protein